jgi:hypothetical protein
VTISFSIIDRCTTGPPKDMKPNFMKKINNSYKVTLGIACIYELLIEKSSESIKNTVDIVLKIVLK